MKYISKNTYYFWLALALIILISPYCLKCVFQLIQSNTDIVKPFKFEKRFKNHQRPMCYDRFLAMNYHQNDLGKAEYRHYSDGTTVCRIDHETLGPRFVNKTGLSMRWAERQLPTVRSGGFYAPDDCRSRHKVAILVPYRERYENLVIFLYYMHTLWQKQKLQYRLFIIKQFGQYKFNKGALYNVGFIETQRFGQWDCLIFHDVDLIPLDERVLYTCPRNPTHMSPAIDSRNFSLQYNTLFGGVTAMTPQHYVAVNGYSNYYWNWGGEDDDMYERLVGARLSMSRLNSTVARYATLPHRRQIRNPNRIKILVKARIRFKSEGLKTVQYRLISINKRKLYTRIVADVNPFNRQL